MVRSDMTKSERMVIALEELAEHAGISQPKIVLDRGLGAEEDVYGTGVVTLLDSSKARICAYASPVVITPSPNAEVHDQHVQGAIELAQVVAMGKLMGVLCQRIEARSDSQVKADSPEGETASCSD